MPADIKVFSPDELREFTVELRQMLIEESRLHPEKYSEIDLKRINEDDEYCHRFLKHFETKNAALKNCKAVLQWRKDFGTNDIKLSNVDKKLFEMAGMHPLGTDKEGSENLFVLVRAFKMSEIDKKELARFLVYWYEYMEKRSAGRQINMVICAAGSGIGNIDLGTTIRLVVPVVMTYYPCLFKNLLVYEFPWILNAIWKIVKNLLSEKYVKKVKFLDAKGLTEYLDENVIPVFMGGTNTYEYVYPHESL